MSEPSLQARVTSALARIVAPLMPFTADEIWRAMPGRGADDCVLLGDFPVTISQQRKIQIVSFLEGGMCLDGVTADSHHFDVLAGEFRHVIAEATGLLGASASKVRWIEVDNDDLLADVVRRPPP